RSAGAELSDVRNPRDVLALDLDRGARLPREPLHRFTVTERVRQEELDRDSLVELDVMRRDDDAHSPGTQYSVHAVLFGEDLAFLDGRAHANPHRRTRKDASDPFTKATSRDTGGRESVPLASERQSGAGSPRISTHSN